MDTKRVFVALDISDQARDAVAKYVDRLRAKHPDVRARWLPPKNLHITLRFVGDVDGNGLAKLDEDVKNAAGKFEPFIVTLAGTGNFAKRKIRADALWLGMTSVASDRKTDVLEDIAAALSPDDTGRRFVPHLTIARIKDVSQATSLVADHLASTFGAVSFTASELIVYESTLRPTGSVYSVLIRHPLAERAIS